METVSSETVKTWLDNGDEYLMIDARAPSAYAGDHIPTAESCQVNKEKSIEAAMIDKSVKWLGKCTPIQGLDKNHKIVVYCNSASCWQSPKAALGLAKMGFTNVKWLRVGINAWKKSGFPIE
mgnify:CR=1 FL=1